jgi:predicted aldo/keto reductase-like oxidoreductase
MSGPTTDLKRRDFLKTSVLAGAGAVAAGSLPQLVRADTQAQAGETTAQHLPSKPFGKTGWTLPILGMGGSAMVERWTSSYGVELLPLDERVAMVRHAYDKGVRYFDTARVYGESEQIMGRGLKGVRDDVYVATKVAVFDPSQTRASIEKSLSELDMSYVNCAQVHSPAIERLGFEGAMKIHAELLKLKDEGLVKFIGLTTHVAFETVYRMIETGGFDQVLLAYGYFKKGMDTLLSNTNLEWRELCLAKAHELDMGIVAMKVMGAQVLGHNAKALVPDYDGEKLARLPAAAIRWTLQDQRVSLLNIGVSKPGDLDFNLGVLAGDLKFTNQDRMLLADFCERAYESATFKEMAVV